MPYKLLLSLAIAVLIGLGSAPASAAAPWQETNICDVPSAEAIAAGGVYDFPTIQSAINEPRCFTVRLGIGTYTEQVTIFRTLTLGGQSFQHGDEHFVSRLRPPAGMIGSILITVGGARTRVKIKHIVIEGPGTGEGLIGIYAGRDTRVSLRDCVLRGMRPPTHDWRWPFLGLYLGGPLLPKTKTGITGHTITNCRFDGYQTAAVVVEGKGTTLTVDHNIIDATASGTSLRDSSAAAPTGIFAFNGAQVTVQANRIRGNYRPGGGGFGVVLMNATTPVIGENNIIEYNDTGIALDGTSGAKIFDNGLNGNGTGIFVGWATACDSNAIWQNRIQSGGTGLYLGQGSSNTIRDNIFAGHTWGHGVILSAVATQNTLDGNRAENNSALGFGDASLGSRAGGTANIYTANLCSGNAGGDSWPAGLCSR